MEEKYITTDIKANETYMAEHGKRPTEKEIRKESKESKKVQQTTTRKLLQWIDAK